VNNDQVPTDEKSAPASTYDSGYFFLACDGHDEFRATRGRMLGARFRKALQLARIRPGQRVLDVGCGRGELVIHAALRGAEGVGIDYSEEAIRIAEEALAGYTPDIHARASFRVMNARRMEFPAESFDSAIMSDIVEHLCPQELREALDETHRVLRRGGRLTVHTCPNRLLYDVAYPMYIRHVHGAVRGLAGLVRYESYFIGPTLPVGPQYPRTEGELRYHVNEQTAGMLARTLTECGFRVAKTEHWEVPHGIEYWRVPADQGSPLRLTVELMLLDALRYLRPFSYAWPLNRVFTNHIWMVAEKK
jgi:SAM-dependent methyltransferase